MCIQKSKGKGMFLDPRPVLTCEKGCLFSNIWLQRGGFVHLSILNIVQVAVSLYDTDLISENWRLFQNGKVKRGLFQSFQ